MAYTTPRTWVAGETVTAQLMNLHIRDNMNVLKTPIDDDGKIRALTSTYLANLDGSQLTGLPKKLNGQFTAVGNVTTGEDDLMSYTLPANTVTANGQAIRITAWGNCANNNNGKTIKLYFGGSQVSSTFSPVANAAQSWRIISEIIRVTSASQEIGTVSSSSNTNLTTNGQTSLRMISQTKDFTNVAGLVIKVTGEATATNDITQNGMVVELIP